MTLIPGIKQISQVGNAMYGQGAIPVGITNTEVSYLADPADTHLLASRDPVINVVSVGMTGNEIKEEYITGTPPLTLSDSEGYPLQWWQVTLSPYQEGAGDPAPDNVRPIHGTDKVTVWTSGKNLLNKTDFVAGTSNATVTTTDTGIKILVTGNGSYRYAINKTVIDYASVAGKAVTLSYHNTNLDGGYARYRVALYKQDGTLKQSLAESAQSTDGDVTATVSIPSNVSEAYSLGIILYANNSDASGASVEYSNLQLEFGSTASSFTPYIASSSSVITLPETIYSGQVYTGGAVSTWGEVDLGTLNWTYRADNAIFYVDIPGIKIFASGVASTMMCEAYPTGVSRGISSTQIPDKTILMRYNYITVILKDTDYTDADTFKAALAGKKLVYPFETPVPFAVTTPTIPTPKGSATTWATAEDGVVDSMEATYIKSE